MPNKKRLIIKDDPNNPKRVKIIDLTNDDTLRQQPAGPTFFSVPQAHEDKAERKESENVEDAYMAMIKQFVAATKRSLSTNILSHIVLTIANDKSLQKDDFLKLRISLCETAAALGTDDIAENTLMALRLAHQKKLFSSDVYRVPPELRQEDLFEKMYEYIDYHLTEAVCNKLKSFKTYGDFLEDFCSDFIAELDITAKKYVKSILAKSAYLIGKGFLDKTIPASKIDTTTIANIFMNFAIEFKNPQALRWNEKQKPPQPKPTRGYGL